MFTQRSINNRHLLLIMLVFVYSLGQQCLRAEAQIFSTPSVNPDVALTQQRVKDIADADISDDPSVIFQDMRDAISSANQLTERSVPEIKERIDVLGKDSSPIKSAIESLREASASCQKDKGVQLQNSLNRMQFRCDEDDSPKVYERVRFLSGLPPQQSCSQTTPEFFVSLNQAYQQDIAEQKAKLSQTIANAQTLVTAYKDRYSALKVRRDKLLKDTGIRGSMLWIVFGVCAFACLILLAVRLFDSDQAMEMVKSGQLIQFPTVMILLVVIVVLGLTNILQENTLGTLLGGVAGYVLSQGVGRAAFREAERSSGAMPSKVDPLRP